MVCKKPNKISPEGPNEVLSMLSQEHLHSILIKYQQVFRKEYLGDLLNKLWMELLEKFSKKLLEEFLKECLV